MSVPFFDLKAQYREIESEIQSALRDFLPTQYFILGPAVESFERSMASYCGSPHAVGISSGTDALLLALEALEIGPGDEVIVPAFSFYASASVIVRRGATPVFVDVSLEDFNLLPRAVAAAITPQTKAIIPVHLFGQTASMSEILPLAQKRGIPVIEDSAQGVGAEENGKRAGSFGRFAAFSFYPTKNLGAFGDGGCLTMGASEDAELVRMLRVHGSKERYIHEKIGGCFRLDALQAIVLEVKLRHLERWQEKRRSHAAFYQKSLQGVGDLVLPSAPDYRRHVYHQYVVRSQRRNALREHLTAQGIGTDVYYPKILPLQPSFESLGYREGELPNSERLSREVLALPIYPELTSEALETIVQGIRGYF